MRGNPVKQKVLRGEPSFGTFGWEFLVSGLPQMVKATGAEFLLLDMEHSGAHFDMIKTQCALCQGLELVPMARVPAIEYTYFARALDAGAMGDGAHGWHGGRGALHGVVHTLSADGTSRCRLWFCS